MKSSDAKTPFSELSSFETEKMLFEALQELKIPENLEPIKSKIVGDYWDSSWLRAPFEECLTFRQLSTLNHDTLIKKKSFTSEKMGALAHAVKRALNAHQKSEPKEAHPSQPQIQTVEWKLPEDMSATAATFLSGFAGFISKLPATHPYKKVGIQTIETIDPLHFAALWLQSTIGDAGLTLLAMNKVQEKKIIPHALNSISKILHESAPELALHWKTALTGVGAYEDTLFLPYVHTSVPHTFINECGIVFIKSLGAEPVLVGGKPLGRHWSLSPKSADAILTTLCKTLSKKKSVALETLSLPFPFYNLDVLHEHITKRKK